MKKYLGMGLAVCGLVLVSGCGGMGELKEFTSASGKFKVMMPGSPKEMNQSAAGIQFKMYAIEEKNGAIMVGYADMPIPAGEGAQEIQTRLDAAVQGMVGNVGANLENKSNITLSGHPGREVKADLPKQNGVMRARIYLVGTRLYQLIVVGKSMWTNSDGATKFLESFQLTQ